jgi:hypothetical protein
MPGLTPNSRPESGISMAMPNQPPQHPSHTANDSADSSLEVSLERSLTCAACAKSACRKLPAA